MRVISIEAVNMGDDQAEIAAWISDYVRGKEYSTRRQFDSIEGELITKACQALGWNSVPSTGGLEVEWEGFFMNPLIGSVDTFSNWVSDSIDWEGDVESQLESLVEVRRDDCLAEWIEV